MRDLAEQFRATMTLPVLLQGETSKGQLLQQFVSAGNALLVATSSFWEGVDVRGDTLSLVIIDKLPVYLAGRSAAKSADGRLSSARRRSVR